MGRGEHVLVRPWEQEPVEMGSAQEGPGLEKGQADCGLTFCFSDIPETVPLTSVNRQCSSGLQAVANIAGKLWLGGCPLHSLALAMAL